MGREIPAQTAILRECYKAPIPDFVAKRACLISFFAHREEERMAVFLCLHDLRIVWVGASPLHDFGGERCLIDRARSSAPSGAGRAQ